MHRALQISEILVVILRAADKKSKLRTAAAMACTCWTFCEPANDVLWEALPCLLPLLNCLSGDAPADSERHLVSPRPPNT
ncbi:uncharacterized protein PHACADRAFT_249096 [Phanerochaete carnosa HHB-10118-sp]|uniref:Uncharacterized protein n=1 Tax=Phanerochaete carnosa (strain HHB-10118-sp) TaxID=650164 RepID=K5WHX9_PHACS|nr:uncharacterized protein PHACADRAFT_249096 [Phanerochaete carnosa HHB-10118-sp]EKM58960.1 hypothetical protein PHACADRAFT_249096 [Phanerochaete carnosa HHB-10118-sp]